MSLSQGLCGTGSDIDDRAVDDVPDVADIADVPAEYTSEYVVGVPSKSWWILSWYAYML